MVCWMADTCFEMANVIAFSDLLKRITPILCTKNVNNRMLKEKS